MAVLVGACAQEQVFASQGFFVVPKTEQGTSIIPLGVRHHLGGWGLGHRALFVVPGRAHIARISRVPGFHPSILGITPH